MIQTRRSRRQLERSGRDYFRGCDCHVERVRTNYCTLGFLVRDDVLHSNHHGRITVAILQNKRVLTMYGTPASDGRGFSVKRKRRAEAQAWVVRRSVVGFLEQSPKRSEYGRDVLQEVAARRGMISLPMA
jgi:hypothetical protein